MGELGILAKFFRVPWPTLKWLKKGQERGYWVYHDQFIFIKAAKIFSTAFFAVILGCWYCALKAERRKAKK